MEPSPPAFTADYNALLAQLSTEEGLRALMETLRNWDATSIATGSESSGPSYGCRYGHGQLIWPRADRAPAAALFFQKFLIRIF